MTRSSSRVRCALMRGGTSKGALFLAEDLPADTAERDDLLLRVMGSPDPRQIDGLGGAHPLTSKVGVVSVSEHPDADVDYLFLQVVVDAPVVSSSQTCGNILAAVGPFALERGLLPARAPTTEVRVRLVNSGGRATLTVQTPGGAVTYDGDTELSGIPGTAAPVRIGLEPSAVPLFPTGRRTEELAGVPVTCIDNGMPTVVVVATELGCVGDEDPSVLEKDPELTGHVARIRAAAVEAMGLDPDLEHTTVPKIVLVSEPRHGGSLCTRSFLPVRVHQAIGVLGAASVAAAAVVPGTVAGSVVRKQDSGLPIRLEHPSGFLDVAVDDGDLTDPDDPRLSSTTVVRTARLIFDGMVFPAPSRTADLDHERADR